MAKKGISLPKIGDQPDPPLRLPMTCFYCQANRWEVYLKIKPISSQWLELICRGCGRTKNL